jgi:hypothetical protein
MKTITFQGIKDIQVKEDSIKQVKRTNYLTITKMKALSFSKALKKSSLALKMLKRVLCFIIKSE